MNKIFTVKAERLAHDGAAEGHIDGRSIRIHGMIPGEEGVVEAHKKHGIYVGTLKELTRASSSRKNPEELHYLSCSPWQVMEYPLQAQSKLDILSDLFSYYPDVPKPGFTLAERFFGYRTKIEFSFCDRDGERDIPLALAFHERGGGSRRLVLPEGCALASQNMNRVALALCARLREAGYVARDLKTLVVRESNSSGELLAILYAKKEEITEFNVDDILGLTGILVFHSTEKSPASVPTKFLWGAGNDHLTETIEGIAIRYSWDSFFQNNVTMFTKAVEMMRTSLKGRERIVELYSGAGTIGLLLAGKAAQIQGVELVPAAVEAANMNAQMNAIENYSAACLPAEGIDASLLVDCDVLVVDPPRAGLHPKLLEHITANPPAQIIYLSCNPETQSRDYSVLKELYRVDLIHGFDFYPQTPHLESLLVLSRRS